MSPFQPIETSGVPVPEILNRLALAGVEGLPLTDNAEMHASLEMCRAWGFRLEILDGRVRFPFDRDSLVPAWIAEETPCISWHRLHVLGFLEIGSTNDEALRRARHKAPEGLVIYAEKQTAGRGRKGRHWISPARAGLYFTFLLRPEQPMKYWPLLTHAASVAIADALNELSEQKWIAHPLKVDLKWPNDVLLSGKKVAGVLLETAAGDRAGVAVGVGVNVGLGSVSDELGNQATSVSEQAGTSVPRRSLLVRFLYYFQLGYESFKRGEYSEIVERWKSYSSMWDGVPVWVDDGDGSKPAVTCGLSELGALKIRTREGGEETVLAADVTVRRSSIVRMQS